MEGPKIAVDGHYQFLEIKMQSWQTPLVTLKAEMSDITDGTFDLECSEVVIETSTTAAAGNAAPAPGDRLKVKNIDAADLKSVTWTPRVVTFSAVGAVEPQEFAVNGMSIDESDRSAVFTLG